MAYEANDLQEPTWEVPIRSFFNAIDINHMLKITQGKLDLADYDSVRASGKQIYDRVSRPDGAAGKMPIPPSEPWTAAMIATFKLWMDRGYPRFEDASFQPLQKEQRP